jgi:hypothetical protein
MKKAIIIFLVCSGIVIILGFVMIVTNNNTYARISSKTSSYEGNYSGAQVVTAGVLMALTGLWAKLDYDKDEKKAKSQRDKSY